MSSYLRDTTLASAKAQEVLAKMQRGDVTALELTGKSRMQHLAALDYLAFNYAQTNGYPTLSPPAADEGLTRRRTHDAISQLNGPTGEEFKIYTLLNQNVLHRL